MRPLHAVVVGVIGLAVLAAGCGGAIPSSNGGPATLKMHGQFLVDAQGQSLYLFEKDEAGESYCTGACAAVWPPLETSTAPSAGAGIQSGALGTVKRSDGDMQVTYHGHPLYYYAADASTPGKTKGEDVEQFGSSWYLVNARGDPVEAESESGSNSGSNGGSDGGSNGGGGGY
jgi:predicted lipoprotein with Yx(FWY)xxD motif